MVFFFCMFKKEYFSYWERSDFTDYLKYILGYIVYNTIKLEPYLSLSVIYVSKF